MTSFHIDFNVLDGTARGATDKKWADLRILESYALFNSDA
jgi:hypothetical protein